MKNRERSEPFEEFMQFPRVVDWRPKAAPGYGPNVRMLPIGFLRDLIKPSLYSNIRRLEADYIGELCADIEKRGMQDPLLIVLDEQGRVCLQDGHHRVVCADMLALEELPVEIGSSAGVAKHNLPQKVLVDLLWDMLR